MLTDEQILELRDDWMKCGYDLLTFVRRIEAMVREEERAAKDAEFADASAEIERMREQIGDFHKQTLGFKEAIMSRDAQLADARKVIERLRIELSKSNDALESDDASEREARWEHVAEVVLAHPAKGGG